MRVIYKYPLRLADHQILRLPEGGTVLSVQEQRGQLVIWAAVDMSQPDVNVEFRIVGTGNPFPNDMLDGYVWLGTVQEREGVFVWHVFGKGPFTPGLAP